MALTFGRTASGTHNSDFDDKIRASKFACPEAAVAEKITALITVTTAPHKIKCAIYRASPLALIGETEEITVPVSNYQERDFLFSSPKPDLISGVDYYLCVWAEAVPGTAYVRIIITTPPQNIYYRTQVYNGWPAAPAFTNAAGEVCLYCTYSLPSNPYPTAKLKKGLISGFHVFLNQYIKSKILGYDPLKLPDGTLF